MEQIIKKVKKKSSKTKKIKKATQVASPRSIKVKQGKFLVVYEKSMGTSPLLAVSQMYRDRRSTDGLKRVKISKIRSRL